jgi:peptidoglycan hydrolase CwlO-like protein
MLKKLVLGTAVLAVAGGLLLGSDALSYLRTFGGNVREAVKSEISVEFELDRIRDEVDSLMPEIRRHMTVVAEQSVDVKDLDRELTEKEARLSKQREAILALRSDLESGKDSFIYRAVSYSRGEVEADLANRFVSYCTAEDCVKRDRQILTAQRDTLRANQQKLDTMLSRKQDLIVKVAQLEARLKQVQAAEAINSIEIDDSHLAHVENMIKEMNHALDVRESVLETEGQVLGRIPVADDDSTPTEGNILGEIDAHFGLEGEGTVAGTDNPDSI